MGSRISPQVFLQLPATETGRAALARRVAEVHAEYVVRTLRGLDCPAKQKLQLLQAVLDTLRDSGAPPDVQAPPRGPG